MPPTEVWALAPRTYRPGGARRAAARLPSSRRLRQRRRDPCGGSGGLDSIVNGVGGPVTSTNPGTVQPVDLVSYP